MEENEKKVLVVKERKEKIAKVWKKIVDRRIKQEKFNLKTAPVTLDIVSVFVPEAAPVLTSISKFLRTKSGKQLTKITNKGYDALGEALKGDMDNAQNKLQDAISLFEVEDGKAVAFDVKNLIDTIGGKSR